MARAIRPLCSAFAGHVRASIAVLAALLVFAACCLLAPKPLLAQQAMSSLLHFPPRPSAAAPPATPSDAPMLVQATEIRYDYTNNTVSAVGNVQIYYNG